MDIYAFALKMEEDGERFYREFAARTTSPGVRNILEMLAGEENKHYRAIQAIQQEDYQMEETDVLENARNIFQRMKVFGEKFVTQAEQAELYRQAMDIEDKSIQFYLDKAEEVELPRQKVLFEKLAGEEKKHYRLMENLTEFVKEPELWLENAEFFRPEQY